MKHQICLCSLALLASCGPSGGGDHGPPNDGTTNGPTNNATESVTYHQDIQPMMDAYCVRCHTEGGIAPFPLTTYEEAKAVAPLVAAAVRSRTMPPFLAAPAVRPLAFDVSLTEEEIALFETWAAGDAPKGDPDATVEPVELQLGNLSRVDGTLEMPVEYTPTTSPDEYRCFVLDWPHQDLQYITGINVRPGNEAVAHHAVAFLIDPDDASQVEAADGADGKPGYPCFGGASPDGAPALPTKIMYGWAPGEQGLDFPDGTGVRVEPGSKIVLQMHYSILAEGAQPDRTALDFRLDTDVAKNAGNLPWLDLEWPSNPESMLIPAGADNVVHEYLADPTEWPLLHEFVPGIDPSAGLVIHSMLPHLHKLGTSISLSVDRQDGTTEPLIEIAKWNFDWQSYYQFEEPVAILPGDQLRIRCTYDNTANNQPVIDGKRREPADVTWGEGTYDEMCAASMYVVGVQEATNDCAEVGSTPADEGTFVLNFKADQIRGSAKLDGELMGTVRGAVYHADDVTITGPKDGVEPLGSFTIDDVDLREGDAGPYPLDFTVPAGSYQIIGFMDIDQNADPDAPGPDVNDPVVIPARAHEMACAEQPVDLVFPILLPDR